MKNLIHSYNNISLLNNFKMLFIFVLLTGCSIIPATINPVEWYKGARDAAVGSNVEKDVGSNAEKEKNIGTSPRNVVVAKSNDSFAKLSSVPARPKVLSGEVRKIISGGLIGDYDATRKYSSEVFRRKNGAENLSLDNKIKTEATEVSPLAPKFLKSDTVIKPLLQPKTKTKTANAYLVPPKRVELSSVQNKTKLGSKTRKRLFSSKTPVSVRPKINKLPAINPSPPKIGNVPRFEKSFRDSQTVIISGSGVHHMSFARKVNRRSYRVPPKTSNVSKVNSFGQLDQDKNQKSYQVATILFPNGSSRVGKGDRRVLRQVIAQYKKVGGMLRIVGHASGRSGTNDPILHKMTNFQVSAARAERVAKELVKMGVKANKMFVGSVSDREPRYYEYMPSGEAGNRRAEIFIDFL
jgi:outer membrane protein OmpA-like peptidoglycan-associated protein